MFQIIDARNKHAIVKSGLKTTAQALKWAKKNLEPNSCSAWGKMDPRDRYYIKWY